MIENFDTEIADKYKDIAGADVCKSLPGLRANPASETSSQHQ
jgi:hypothetical protein